jgi:hypothetical protein
VGQAGIALAIIVILDLLDGGVELGRQPVGIVTDEIERDPFGLAELFAMSLEEISDLLGVEVYSRL